MALETLSRIDGKLPQMDNGTGYGVKLHTANAWLERCRGQALTGSNELGGY